MTGRRALLVAGVVIGALVVVASVSAAVTIAVRAGSDDDGVSRESRRSPSDIASGDFASPEGERPAADQAQVLDEMSSLFTRISSGAASHDRPAVLAACLEGASRIPEWRAVLVPAAGHAGTPHVEAALEHYGAAFTACQAGDLATAASEISLGAEEMHLATATLTPTA